MNSRHSNDSEEYRTAMGQLLALYTQVDHLIMEVCAERIAGAPDEAAKLGLAKQVGEEQRHVSIQRAWLEEFGTDPAPVVAAAAEEAMRAHFRDLSWRDFLADLYLGVEALGGEAVQEIVPVADPGTRESLRIPLEDEVDHVAFGLGRLRQELAALPEAERRRFLTELPDRLEGLADAFHGLDIDLPALFQTVGVPYSEVREAVLRRRADLLEELAAELDG
ncbi:MAG: hypothetical protein PVF51_12125 [Nitrospirota bacterium]|jgi:hypothetical protein